MQALRTAVKQSGPAVRRQFSAGSAEEAWGTAQQFKQASKGMVAACGVLTTILARNYSSMAVQDSIPAPPSGSTVG